MTTNSATAAFPLGTILRDPGSGRLAVRCQQWWREHVESLTQEGEQ